MLQHIFFSKQVDNDTEEMGVCLVDVDPTHELWPSLVSSLHFVNTPNSCDHRTFRHTCFNSEACEHGTSPVTEEELLRRLSTKSQCRVAATT